MEQDVMCTIDSQMKGGLSCDYYLNSSIALSHAQCLVTIIWTILNIRTVMRE